MSGLFGVIFRRTAEEASNLCNSSEGLNETEHAAESTNPLFRENLVLAPVTAIFSGLVIFTIFVEWFLQRVEHAFHDYPPLMRMTEKLYKELMILGLVSFSVFIIELSFHIPERWFISFEFAHMWIFLLAVVYVLYSIAVMVSSKRIKGHWLRLSAQEPLHTLKDYRDRHKLSEGSNAWQRHFCLFIFFGHNAIEQSLEFHIAKRQFFAKHPDIPPHFDFSLYIRTGVSEEIVRALEVKPLNYFVLLCVLALNLARSTIFGDGINASEEGHGVTHHHVREISQFVVFGWALFLIMYGLLIGLRWLNANLLTPSSKWEACFKSDAITAENRRLAQSNSSGRPGHVRTTDKKTFMPSSSQITELKQMQTAVIRRDISEANSQTPAKKHPLLVFLKAFGDSITLLQCLYLALVLMMVVRMIYQEFPHDDASVAFSMIAVILPPCLGGLVLRPAIIRNQVLLQCVANIDHETFGKVVRHMYEQAQMKVSIATTISSKLESEKAREDQWTALFNKVDANGDGRLSVSEFQKFLAEHADLKLSRRAVTLLLRSAEHDQDGYLSIIEFHDLLNLDRHMLDGAHSLPHSPIHDSHGAGGVYTDHLETLHGAIVRVTQPQRRNSMPYSGGRRSSEVEISQLQPGSDEERKLLPASQVQVGRKTSKTSKDVNKEREREPSREDERKFSFQHLLVGVPPEDRSSGMDITDNV